MKVRILGCSDKIYWYHNCFGQIFEVMQDESNINRWYCIGTGYVGRLIMQKDCEVINEIITPLHVHPDIHSIREACQKHVDNLRKGNVDDDDEHYIYEAAMEFFYGKDVWKEINQRR
jgi:hypothetical protein